MEKIIFCHLPKTGGYSFLNWIKTRSDIYEFNDTARSLSDDEFYEKYNNAKVVEIHGGNPGSLAKRAKSCGIDIYQNNLIFTIVRNPVSQYESLWRVAHEKKALLDIPVAVSSIRDPGITIEDIYTIGHSEATKDIDECFALYERFHLLKSKEEEVFSTEEEREFITNNNDDNPIMRELRMNHSNMNYLFRRDPQAAYINKGLDKNFLRNYRGPTLRTVIATTEMLDKTFLFLAKNSEAFRKITILKDLDICKTTEEEILGHLKNKRTNISPTKLTLKSKLSASNAYKYISLNMLDYSVWLNSSKVWSQILNNN